MIRAHRIPTTRRYPRALTVICLFVVAFLAAVVLSGCNQPPENRFPRQDIQEAGIVITGGWIGHDTKTGCDWIMYGDRAIPRTDSTGKQICR